MDHALADQEPGESVDLSRRQRMIVLRRPEADVVQFLSREGEITLSVILTEAGPVLRFSGASLALQASGSLSLEAEHVHLHGRSGVSMSTDGDLIVRAKGDLISEARVQTITATLGDVSVSANDDVRLVGERVRMNC